MTDNTDALDELVSRYLDAEATADEVARVESDPALTARADAMRAAIEAVAAPVTIPELDLDRIRATVIAEAGTTTDSVTDLAAARARKLERRNRFMAVAAAFVFLALGFAAVQGLGGDDDDSLDTADAGTESESQSASASATSDADESLEMFSDDDMAEEDDDMAEESEAATAESADMAEEDDMADEDDMAEEEDAAESDDADGEDAGGDDAAAIERLGVDVLPDELAPVASLDDLLVVIDEAYADVVDVPPPGEPFFGVCNEAIDLIAQVQDDRTVSVEQAIVDVDGEAVTVIVALDFAGETVVLVHPVDECAVSSVISPGLP